MCTTCGCSADHHSHSHEHEHEHQNARLIQVEKDLLSKNNHYAKLNRERLAEHDLLCLNILSSPGSGKTTLLSKTITLLPNPARVMVIEGDQQTERDAERIRQTGAIAEQINTGKGCHLDAHAVGHALQAMPLNEAEYVFIENVGNLVCPAAFDLGEHEKVVLLSVTEGEDKPLKYPDMFRVASLMILNKIDLLPYVEFDVEQCIAYAKRINPAIEVIRLSATSDEGLENWLAWLKEKQTAQSNSRASSAVAQAKHTATDIAHTHD